MTLSSLIVCPVCNGRTFSRSPYFYRFGGRTIDIVMCDRCDLGTLAPMLSPQEIESLYSIEYFERDYHCGCLQKPYSEQVRELREEFEPMLSLIKQFRQNGILLEVGCAGGAMLAEARDQGFETLGVELNAAMAQWGREKLGLDIRIGTLEDQAFPDNSFDVIFLGDVIEHLPHPLETLAELRRVLRTNGLLVLAYPMELHNISAKVRKLFGLRRQSPHKPYHLFYYHTSNLRKLLERSGFHELMTQQDKSIRTRPWHVRLLDELNRAVTNVFGVFGDRGLTLARKE
jgi:SAM-dependent methyltransferase